MTNGTLTIQEVAELTGLSSHTLRYYERIGLIRPVDRADSGHRRYSGEDVGWIDFLKKLRSTGMPIREMKEYAELVWQGDHTSAARRKLLEKHQERMRAKLEELNDCLACLGWKIEHYREFEAMAHVSVEEEEDLAATRTA